LLTDRRKFLVYPNRLDIFETPWFSFKTVQ
jgi:hypothetical protein